MRSKMISSTTVLGELGVNLIARVVMEMGCIWYPTGSVEAGIDGHIELRDAATGTVLNAVIGVQSKATAQAFSNETDSAFDYHCNERDLEYWLKGNLPVVLVVSRPSTDEAYWVSIKDYFRDPKHRATRKVHFDKRNNRFDSGSKSSLFQIAMPSNAGIYLATPNMPERLISNLLPVAFLPDRLFVANTEYRDARELFRDARGVGVDIGGEWILRNKRLISFRDLRQMEWTSICDQSTVEDFSTAEWSETEDEDRRRDFVNLLRRTLREMFRPDLGYNEKLRLFYFRATPDLTTREVAYQGLAKTAERAVFMAYPADDKSVKYYRHSAFHDRFHRFDGQWYLEVTPTYFYTSDGYRMKWGYDQLLKRIKEIEGHEAVRGQLIMWTKFLTPHADMFRQEPYPFLGFWDSATFEVSRGIDEKSWNEKRDQAQEQDEKRAQRSSAMTLPLFSS